MAPGTVFDDLAICIHNFKKGAHISIINHLNISAIYLAIINIAL
jgi:hypothetical protein